MPLPSPARCSPLKSHSAGWRTRQCEGSLPGVLAPGRRGTDQRFSTEALGELRVAARPPLYNQCRRSLLTKANAWPVMRFHIVVMQIELLCF